MDALVAWVRDRETLRIRKASNLQPWTCDAILRKYKFCNVRRKDDRVSKWITGVIEQYGEAEYLGEWLALSRFVNWPPTLALLLQAGHTPEKEPDWHGMADEIERLSQAGGKVWTGAYMVRSDIGSKANYVCANVLMPAFSGFILRDVRAALEKNTRRAVHSVLSRCYGWGPFMAGQVVDDWSWTSLLNTATDNYTWAPQGPGSVRGLNRLLGRPLRGAFTDVEWQERLIECREQIIADLGKGYEDLTLHDVQNCLCEFDKYERARLGEGRPRSIYKPETAF